MFPYKNLSVNAVKEKNCGSEKYTNHRHTICGQNVEFLVLNLVVHKVTTGL